MEPSAGRSRTPRLGTSAEAGRRGARCCGPRKCRSRWPMQIGQQLPDLLPDSESFEANRASTEASILGFAQILEQGADPARISLGAPTLAYAQEGARRGVPMTTLIRSYRLGHAAAWEGHRGPDRRARGGPGSTRDRDRDLLCVAVRLRRRGVGSCRGLLQRGARALGPEHGRDPRRDDRHDPGGCSDRQRAGRSAPGLRDRPSAHRGDRVAARHTKKDATRMPPWRLRSRPSATSSAPAARSCTRSVSSRSPRGSALATRPVPSWMTSGSTPGSAPGFVSLSANPHTGSRDSAGATARPCKPAASRNSPAARRAPSPATGELRSQPIATADLDQARTFVRT